MFRLSSEPIHAEELKIEVADPGAGALLVFEGHVRAHNLDRRVLALEYEGAEALAAREFERIEAEARARFAVTRILCVHRTGKLQVGEMAVWIGVSAGHRGAAFDACRFLIDELKHRLPIWKKEHYADGDSGWLNAP